MPARLNVEPSIWSDLRYQNFAIKVADPFRAIGMLIYLWMHAQKYWWPDKKLIPVEVWAALGFSDALIDCGLAERRPDGIYPKGIEDAFAWWFDRQAAGRKGGLASGKSRRRTADPIKLDEAQLEQNKLKQIEASSSCSDLPPFPGAAPIVRRTMPVS